jgi:carboxymethylenebutenolidase
MKINILSSVLLLALPGQVFAADAGMPGGIPADADHVVAVLNKSPRHGEWIDIKVPDKTVPLKSYVVYPERSDKAPVVIIIHEIYGESDWIRGVADQFAAEGFIAIAPDMLSGHGPNNGGTDSLGGQQQVTAKVRELTPPEVTADLNAARAYALTIPAASGKIGVTGFCWGGGQSFAYAASQPGLDAAVVYYGMPPQSDDLTKIKAPIAGFYGGNDGHITLTVKPTKAAMDKLGKTYEPHVYEGAGHGFLRQTNGDRNAANLKAAEQAWPATIAFLKEHLK